MSPSRHLLRAALLLALVPSPPTWAAPGVTATLLPAQVEEAWLFDLAAIRRHAAYVFQQGKLAAWLQQMVDDQGPDLRQEGLRELALGRAPEALGPGAQLLAVARQDGAPAQLGARGAAFAALRGGLQVTPRSYRGVTIHDVGRPGEPAPLGFADLAPRQLLASGDSAGQHALLLRAIDTLRGENPSFASAHASWGELLDGETFGTLLARADATWRQRLRGLGLEEAGRVRALRASVFNDPEFGGVVGVQGILACADDADRDLVATSLEQALQAWIARLPADDPWREALEDMEVLREDARVVLQGMVDRALLEGYLKTQLGIEARP